MFRLSSASKSYDGKRVLNEVDLLIQPGETTVLIGPSGSGKSTVLSLMTGLIEPDEGTVSFDDKPVAHQQWQAIRRRLGYVIQEGGLFPHLTGLSNVTLLARHLGWPADKIRARVDELCTLTRLSADLLARYPAEMSGGQRQRVSLMRALMLDAEVLLLDEPLGALDPMVRVELQADLAEIFDRLKKTVVLVTHDLDEAIFFADRIVLMRGGSIVQTGTADDLLQRPAEPFVSRFVKAQRGHIEDDTQP